MSSTLVLKPQDAQESSVERIVRADSQTWGRAQESAFSQGLLSSSPSPPPTQGIWGTNCTLINIV